jgi:hypothetical protein
MQYATGSRFGTATAGTTGSVTLAASDNAPEADVLGREVVIYSGTGIGSIAQVTAYDSLTKIATVAPAFAVAPGNGSGYVFLDSYEPVQQKDITLLVQKLDPVQPGSPSEFYPFGDEVDGGFILFPVPYRTDAQPMVLLERYFSDLTELDLAGTLMTKLYQKWRNLWICGIKWKTMEDGDDDRATVAAREYRAEIRKLIAAEDYSNTLGTNRAVVTDY